jgi:hypothetical protein
MHSKENKLFYKYILKILNQLAITNKFEVVEHEIKRKKIYTGFNILATKKFIRACVCINISYENHTVYDIDHKTITINDPSFTRKLDELLVKGIKSQHTGRTISMND